MTTEKREAALNFFILFIADPLGERLRVLNQQKYSGLGA
jgi:hypothetical protein